MPESSVSSCVLNILGSFSSSLALYKKIRDKRRRQRRSRKEEKESEEEQRLTRSLRQGPEDISQEYQNSIYIAGDQYAIGDAIAQTSLAEIVLRLNVGLVGIITNFLNHDNKRDVQLDYVGLANLSERCRIDTCRTLRQLFKRLTQLKPQRTPLTIKSREDVEADEAQRTPQVVNGARSISKEKKPPKIRGPMLAQVVIQDSNKPPQIAMVRPGERRRKARRSSEGSKSGSSSLSKARSESTLVSPTVTTPPPAYSSELPRRPSSERTKSAPDIQKARRKPSVSQVSSKSAPTANSTTRASKSTARLNSTLLEPLSPLPHTGPLPAASTQTLVPPTERRQRKPTPTYYSIASDSTKIGEIPLHKWAVPCDFDRMELLNREAYREGWPNVAGESNGRKRGGFLRVFGRRGT